MVAVELGVAITPRPAVLNPRPDVRSIKLATARPAAHEPIAVSAAAARRLEKGFDER